MNTLKKLTVLFFAFLLLPSLSGCALAVGIAIGGTAGYVLKDQGYKVQSPVTKNK